MGSFRAGQLFDSLSEGFGTMAVKRMQEEQARLDKEWQLTLANLRETNAAAREGRQYAHAEELARTREEGATTRAAAATTATSEYREQTLTAEESRFQRKRVDDARQNLQKSLLDLEKGMREEMELVMHDPTQQERVSKRYTELKDSAITGTVAWLASNGLPGYEVDDEKDLQALLIQNGMDVAGSKDHAKQIWGSISGGGPLMTPDNQPPRDPYAGPSQLPHLPDPDDPNKRITNPDYVADVTRRESAAAAQQPGAPSVAMPSVALQDPGGRQAVEAGSPWPIPVTGEARYEDMPFVGGLFERVQPGQTPTRQQRLERVMGRPGSR